MPSATSQKKASTLRLLILSPEQPGTAVTNSTSSSSHPSPFPAFLQVLTNAKPPQEITTFAGYTDHAPLHLKTKYYETDVSIWCDVLPPPSPERQHVSPKPVTTSQTPIVDVENDGPWTTTLQAWQDQMTSDAALEVRRAIGGIVVLLPFTKASSTLQPTQRSRLISNWTPYIEAVSALRDVIEDDTAREVGSIVVLQDMSPILSSSSSSSSPNECENTERTDDEMLESLEDECMTSRGIMGWDFVSWHAANQPATRSTEAVLTPTEATRNKFGEKVGIPRVTEVLEGIDWFASAYDDDEDDAGEVNDVFADDGTDGLSATMTDDLDSVLKSPFIPTNSSASRQQSASLAQHQQRQSTPANAASDPHAEVWSALDTPDSNINTNDNITASDPTFEEDIQIAQLQRLMDRAVVMRERASEMKTPEERERFARREVKRLMEEDGW